MNRIGKFCFRIAATIAVIILVIGTVNPPMDFDDAMLYRSIQMQNDYREATDLRRSFGSIEFGDDELAARHQKFEDRLGRMIDEMRLDLQKRAESPMGALLLSAGVFLLGYSLSKLLERRDKDVSPRKM